EDAGVVHGLAEVVERLLVVLVGTVGEVEARDVHAGAEELLEHGHGAGGRSFRIPAMSMFAMAHAVWISLYPPELLRRRSGTGDGGGGVVSGENSEMWSEIWWRSFIEWIGKRSGEFYDSVGEADDRSCKERERGGGGG
ncbi:unnamed protein product, partial [Urochloa humidicola]